MKKLTDKTIGKLADLLERGVPLNTALDFLFIDRNAYDRWMARGMLAAEEDYESLPRFDRTCLKLARETRRAIASHRIGRIDNLHDDENEEWRRDLAILERRDPKNWGRNLTVTDSDEAGAPDLAYL